MGLSTFYVLLPKAVVLFLQEEYNLDFETANKEYLKVRCPHEVEDTNFDFQKEVAEKWQRQIKGCG